ncbi:MAG: amidohydrolase family protein [Bryobacteraceae bacterium]
MKFSFAVLMALAVWLPALCAAVTVIPDVTVIDGTGGAPIQHATVIIEGEKIREIRTSSYKPRRGERALHFEGKFVMPGLISAHSHLGLVDGTATKPENYNETNIERQLKQYEEYGVTTVMSLGLNKDLLYQLRDEQRAGKLGGAAILTAGRGIGVPGGVPGLNVGSDQVYRPKTPEEARRAVREMAAHHPDIIKTWVDDNLGKSPRPNFEVEAAVIDEAHKQGLKVAAHVFYLADAKKLVSDGVDVLAHSVRDKPVDSEFMRLVKQHGTVYIPTLQLEEAFFIYPDKPDWIKSPFFLNALQPSVREMLLSQEFAAKVQSDPATIEHRQFLATAEQNLKRLADAGVTIGFGTDSGATPTRIAGFAEHRELQLMVEAGLSPTQAIHSATSVNASFLAIPQTGTLAAGKQADVLVLDADPLSEIENTEKIAAVIHNGSVVTR